MEGEPTARIKAIRQSFARKNIEQAVTLLKTERVNNLLKDSATLATEDAIHPIVQAVRIFSDGKADEHTTAQILSLYSETLDKAVASSAMDSPLISVAVAVSGFIAGAKELKNLENFTMPDKPSSFKPKTTPGGLWIP